VARFRVTFKTSFRLFAVLLGAGLLAYLVLRTGPQTIWKNVQAIGWGLALIVLLGGISHLVKTWAWRLTFTCDMRGLSWPRSFAMRLIAEAFAQIGIAGKVLGEGVRVSLLGSAVPIANGISSGVLDAGIYTLTAAIVSVLGMVAALLLAPVPGKWRIYALLFIAIFLGVVSLAAVAIAKRWRFIASATRAVGRLPGCQGWVSGKLSVINSAENSLLSFHRDAPARFWGTIILNFVCHALAILEVYIVLRFMGARVALSGAFALEGFTKLINLVGTLNPGNVGTYEGGNVLVTKFFGITAGSGLTLALCRRARAMVWAAIGALCLILVKRLNPRPEIDLGSDMTLRVGTGVIPEQDTGTPAQQRDAHSIVIVDNTEGNADGFSPSLARVGTLPVLLRSILTVHSRGAGRVIVCLPSASAQQIRSFLLQTGRLPPSVEWRETNLQLNLLSLIAEVAGSSHRVVVLAGNRTYQPRLIQSAFEWKGDGALALTTGRELAGVYVLSQAAAVDLGKQSKVPIPGLSGVHAWIQSHHPVDVQEVEANSWHEVITPEDLRAAERKLDTWLVKPTDGIFARNNRKISIPISRQIIKFPITPNMVTLIVLAVSFGSGVFFARAGYWNTLVGAAFSVAASILDGCDGEVARLKLQATKFGCWLETVCDYLYYLFVFGGMAVGLTRSSGTRIYLAWGGLLGFGAIMSFLVISFTRHRLSGSQPEKFLSTWQKKADSRPLNPLLFLGRHTEFIIRRCFFPYALLCLAIMNMTKFAFVATALGANLVWLIALYSVVTFSRKTAPGSAGSAAALSATGD